MISKCIIILLQKKITMNQKYFTLIILLLFIGLTGCNSQQQKTENNTATKSKPLNIILLIGDGMGLSEVSSSFYYSDQTSNFERFKEISLINTSSATDKITDSGAGGTAFSCGVKTYNGAIGMDADSNQVKNIVEVLSKQNYHCGIISTSAITHATPASFYAHVINRKMEEDIALQLLHSEVDFFAGGGLNFFNKRKDGQNLISMASDHGFELDTATLQKKSLDINKKYGYLLANGGMPSMLEDRGNFLQNATSLALNHLGQAENGFFLMVEGSQIDWAGHANDADFLIAEMLDFDKTIGVAMDFAERNQNTLVIVLADHETGGFTLSAGSNYNEIEPSFSTGGHSSALIPVFAYGPGAENFKGIYQNNEIFHKMLKAAK